MRKAAQKQQRCDPDSLLELSPEGFRDMSKVTASRGHTGLAPLLLSVCLTPSPSLFLWGAWALQVPYLGQSGC